MGLYANDEMSEQRVFCAIELPADVRAHAAQHIARLREIAPDVRASWERAEKMHITLKFLGEIDSERVVNLQSAAERAMSSVAPFDLSIEGTGAFPQSRLARVLWLGVADASGGLRRLQQRLEDECAREGFAHDEKRFHPHLTIARLRHPSGAKHLAALHSEMSFKTDSFSITELIVIRSELGPRGSSYTEISRHHLSVK
jgi:RNA 2',3'-cyclic 3'-phosphodiesterase